MEFTETITLKLPDFAQAEGTFLSEYHQDRKKRSMKDTSEGLIVEIAAIHEGMTANYNMYTREALEASLESWISPYSRPVIINHDTNSQPLGRVMNAEIAEEEDGSAFVKLQIAVMDPEAIAKVLDGRYLTGSVGGKAGKAICSICDADWANASLHERPCRHERGSVYKGKLAFLQMYNINFKEYSFVNVPADERSRVMLDPGMVTESQNAKLFTINLNEQEIVDLSHESINILSHLRLKEARPIYMQTKGAFLSALADVPADSKETELNDANLNQEDELEDILDVTETLSDDLAQAAEANAEEDQEEVATDEEAELTSEDEAVEETADTEETDDVEEATDEEDAPELTSEEEETEEQATDEEENKLSAAADEADAVEEEPEDEIADDTEASDEVEESDNDVQEAIAELEARVAELEQRESELQAKNDKLKAALKKGLAERVVDQKVALGMVENSTRAESIEEHLKRSASSLADSLRDLSSMKIVDVPAPIEDAPIVEQLSGNVQDDVQGSVSEEDENPQAMDPEKVFVDALMGRLSL